MAIVIHKNIVDAELHVPKGFASANNGDYSWKNELGELEYNDELVLPAALDFVDASLAPPTESTGDVYVLSLGGSVHADWDSVSLKDWVRYDGTTWNSVTPQKASLCYDKTTDFLQYYDGSAWASMKGGISNVTSAGKAALTPSTGDFVYDTDLLSLQRYDGSNWKTIAGYSPFGIADSSGSYTYYSTLTLAVAAVATGGTIEQFGNVVETGSVVISITKSLTLNMNGYTYTLDNVDGTHAFSVSGAAADLVKISNGIISRKNGTGRNMQYVSTAITDVLDLTGTILTNESNNNWLLVGLTGHVIGGTYLGTNGIALENSAVLSDFTYEGSGTLKLTGASATKGYINSSNATYAVNLVNSAAVVSFLEVKATVNVGIWSVGNIHQCNIEAVGYGVYSYGSDSKVTGTHAYSSGSIAFYLDAGQIINCEGYSDGNSALFMQGGVTNGTMAKGCYFMSSAKYAIWIGNNGANIYDCYAECTLNSTLGHGIGFTSNAVSKIVNCELVVTNAGAYALSGTASGFLIDVRGYGMTTFLTGFTETALATALSANGNGIIA